MNRMLRRMILHMIQKKAIIRIGVPAIIINAKGEILLGKRSDDHVFYPSLWGLPGGFVEYGETLEQAVKREVREELGVEVRVVKTAKSFYENLPNKECSVHSIDVPHYCKITRGKPEARDETSEVKWFKSGEIKRMRLAYSHKKILREEGLI